MKRPSMQHLRTTIGTSRGRMRLLDLPTSREAADDLRLYLALCAIGVLPLNLVGWTRERLPLFELDASQQAVHVWATRHDPTCKALLDLIQTGKNTKVTRDWVAKAKKEAATWRD